jgi:trimethylamine--corrinoid protein Co-methyltransferase
MKIWGSADVLNSEEIEEIERRAFYILSNIGVRVDHSKIRKQLKVFGASENENILFFSSKIIEDFLLDSSRIDYDFSKSFEFSAGGYPQFFLPHGKKVPIPYKLKNMVDMVRLANSLDNLDVVYSGLGIPDDIDIRSFELYQKLIRWKYFKRVKSPISDFKPYHDGPSLISTKEMVKYALEFGRIMAEEESGDISEYTYGDVYINSPLYFAKNQAEIFWELYLNGCHCDVGTVMSLGGTAPVTYSAALPLQLAEILFINILQRVFYEIPVLTFVSVLSPLDMKKGIFQYGRPELSISISAMGQIARKYGALYNCSSYFCDAKLPSSEAGMQKTMSAIAAVYAGSYGISTAGLLSVDEIASPEQLIIDSEFAGAIKRFAKGINIIDGPDEFEMINRIGHGGSFTGEISTVRDYKQNWIPQFFSQEMLSGWLTGKPRIDTDYAGEIYLEILKTSDNIYIKEITERKLLKLIKSALKDF